MQIFGDGEREEKGRLRKSSQLLISVGDVSVCRVGGFTRVCLQPRLTGRFLKADLHGTTLSHAMCLRQVYDMNRFV